MNSSVVRNPRFLSLWVSQIVSQLTVNVLSFAILVMLYDVTQSPIAASLLWVAYAIPAIIVGPFAAAAVDIFDKKKVLMFSNLLQAATVLIYGFILYKKLVFLSYVVVFLYSFFNQFYVPAEAAAMAIFLPKEKLAQANGLFFITQQSALVLGFGLGGILVEAFGFRPTIFLSSASLFIAFLAVTFLPSAKSANKLPSEFESRVGDFFNHLLTGYRFIRNTKRVLFSFGLLLGLQVILVVLITNLPPIANDLVMIQAKSSGVAIVIPAGIGAFIATFAMPRLLAKIRKRDLILVTLAALSIDIIAVSLVVPLIPLQVVRVGLAAVLFGIAGFCVVGALAPSITFLQEKTPHELLGRVFGNLWFLTTIVTIVPVIFGATITEVLGIRALLLMIAVFGLFAFFVSRYKVREI